MPSLQEWAENILLENKIIHPPVNVFQIIKNEGFGLKISHFPDDIGSLSGLCITRNDVTHILINKNNILARRRFTAGHELKHALLEPDLDHATLSTHILKDVESGADQFSAELLMPTGLIADFVTGLGFADPYCLKSIFGVSYKAAVFRLKNLGYLSNTEAKDMLHQKYSENRKKFRINQLARLGSSNIPSTLQDWIAVKRLYDSAYGGPVQYKYCKNYGCDGFVINDNDTLCWCCGEVI